MENVYKAGLAKNCVSVMLDIETLGLTPDSIILSIGACAVEAPTEVQFYQEVSIHGQCGRCVDLDTVKWWMNQDISPPMGGIIPLPNVLANFTQWLQEAFVDKAELIVWANGTDFDISVLKDAYERAYVGAVPWKYNNVRDYRTAYKLFSHIARPEFVGDRHNALADAVHQASHLALIMEHMKVYG